MSSACRDRNTSADCAASSGSFESSKASLKLIRPAHYRLAFCAPSSTAAAWPLPARTVLYRSAHVPAIADLVGRQRTVARLESAMVVGRTSPPIFDFLARSMAHLIDRQHHHGQRPRSPAPAHRWCHQSASPLVISASFLIAEFWFQLASG